MKSSANVTCGRCGSSNADSSRCRECGDALPVSAQPKRARTDRFPLVLALVVLVPVSIVAIGFVFILVAFKTYFIPSRAMEPTLRIHDVLFANRLVYKLIEPKDGDVVIFDPPIPNENHWIKRIVATPGETLQIRSGRLYRNSAAVNESYIAQPTAYDLDIKNYAIYVDGKALEPSEADIPPREEWTSPDTLPPNCYILLGDNRNNSDDSHIWGFARSNGFFDSGPRAGRLATYFEKATAIFYPANRMRNL